MDELPGRLVALLNDARCAHDPQPEDARRVGHALAALIPGFQPFQPAAASPGIHASATRSLFGATSAGKVGLLLVLPIAAAVAIRSTSRETLSARPNAAIASAQRAANTPNGVPTSPLVQTEPATRSTLEPLAAPASRPRVLAARSTRTQHRAPSVDAPAVFATTPPASAELPLIRRAAQALRDRRLALAQQLLEQHAALFPEGALKLERIGMLVITLCQQGKTPEAQPMRMRLLLDAPDYPLADRMTRACERSTTRAQSSASDPQ